jgi:hypothetical protein
MTKMLRISPHRRKTVTANAGTSPSSPPYISIDGIARVLIVMMIVGTAIGIVSAYYTFLDIAAYISSAIEVILFLLWFYRAHRNLPALEATELRFTPRWAIIWWFIPILNFWKPYQVTLEIIKSSDPSVGATDSSTRRALMRPSLVLMWWVYTFIAIAIAIGLGLGGGPLGFTTTVSGVSASISTMLTILVIREITKRQTQKIGLVHSGTSDNS